MRGPEAHGLQAAPPTELSPASPNLVSPASFPTSLKPQVSGCLPTSLKRPPFSSLKSSYPIDSPWLWRSGRSPEETVLAAKDSEGSALPKVQKSSVPTPSLTTSQPPRGLGTEPHPGQMPSHLLPTDLQRRPMSLLLPQANLLPQA